MIKFPQYLDDNVSRPVAIVVFMTSFTTLLRPEFSVLLIFLFGDFILRYIHPKLSPTVFFSRTINNVLGNEPKPKFSPPKRFAILIGIIVSGLASLGLLISSSPLVLISTSVLLFASFLQGFFGYCVGCKVHDLLIKIGLINTNKPIYANLKNVVQIK